MYPSNVTFASSSAGLIDDDKNTVVVVDAVTPLDAIIDRDLILTLSTHYDTVTVVLKRSEQIPASKPVASAAHTTSKPVADETRPTCEEGDCTCTECEEQREWDNNYDSNTGVLRSDTRSSAVVLGKTGEQK